jgi:N-sulfoglucosamine sulfohydrolase
MNKSSPNRKYLWLYLLSFLFLGNLQKEQPPFIKAGKRPNILFCIADDASLEFIGAYGSSLVKTPAFDRVAKEGLLFVNAYTPNAKCSPSRACILTGRNSWQLEAAGNHAPIYPEKFITFIEALKGNGYKVGFTGKGWAPGNPGEVEGKPRQLTGPAYSDIKMETPTKEMSPINYAANFEAFLKSQPVDKPFCFWYGGHEPHRAYEYGSGVAKGKKKLIDIKKVPEYWMDNDTVRNDMLDYAYEVEYFDSHLQKILDILEKKGELENTIIVATSDNGMPFPRVKGQVYEFDNHLPLAIMWKNHINNPGRKIKDYISFIDFAPTFLELAGLRQEESQMQPIQGKSIMNLLTSGKENITDAKRDHVLLGKERTDVGRPHDMGYPVRAIVKGGFMYIKNYEPGRWPTGNPETGYLDCDGSPTKTAILESHRNGNYNNLWQMAFGKREGEELYQVSKDPYCLKNLANDRRYSSTKNNLKSQMEQELKMQHDPRMYGNGNVFDNYPYGEPKVRNFYERFKKGEQVKAGWVNESDFEKNIK